MLNLSRRPLPLRGRPRRGAAARPRQPAAAEPHAAHGRAAARALRRHLRAGRGRAATATACRRSSTTPSPAPATRHAGRSAGSPPTASPPTCSPPARPATRCRTPSPGACSSRNARAEAARLAERDGPRLASPASPLVATVPPQHMYGFESSVLLGAARRRGVRRRPAVLPGRHRRRAARARRAPRMLVTTPFHLKALLEARLRAAAGRPRASAPPRRSRRSSRRAPRRPSPRRWSRSTAAPRPARWRRGAPPPAPSGRPSTACARRRRRRTRSSAAATCREPTPLADVLEVLDARDASACSAAPTTWSTSPASAARSATSTSISTPSTAWSTARSGCRPTTPTRPASPGWSRSSSRPALGARADPGRACASASTPPSCRGASSRVDALPREATGKLTAGPAGRARGGARRRQRPAGTARPA